MRLHSNTPTRDGNVLFLEISSPAGNTFFVNVHTITGFVQGGDVLNIFTMDGNRFETNMQVGDLLDLLHCYYTFPRDENFSPPSLLTSQR